MHQISIFEGFLKDHVTLKTGLMAAKKKKKNLHCHQESMNK